MKKWTHMLLPLILAFTLTACGSDREQASAAQETTAPAEAGAVYYLNPEPGAQGAWEALAAVYTAETGVEVRIQTTQPEDYQKALKEAMGGPQPVTLFQCATALDLARWEHTALDLSGTALAEELSTQAFNLYTESGEWKAIGFACDAYGLLVNLDLLADAGYSVSELQSFEDLKAVADSIHERAAVLGFDAFACAGLDRSSLRFAGHLANLPLYYEFRDRGLTSQPDAIAGSYLERLRSIWDLYITDSAIDPKLLPYYTDQDSRNQFTTGQAVFYQGGTWEYEALLEAGMEPRQLTMIPIYCGIAGEEAAGLCAGTDRHWVLNSRARPQDLQATLDFLHWVVTSETGTQVLADTFGCTPFRAGKTLPNSLWAAAESLEEAGRKTIPWTFQLTPNGEAWRDTVVTALNAYSADPTDDTWTMVVDTIVEGWAYEYSMVTD